MCDYALERRHFAEDEEEDEDPYNGDGPEERREPLWWGLRALHGIYEDKNEGSSVDAILMQITDLWVKRRHLQSTRVRMNDCPTTLGTGAPEGVM